MPGTMGHNNIRPLGRSWLASAARTSTSNSGTLNLHQANSHLFILDCTAASGTSPTLDVALQVTPDFGTTYYSVLRFAQLTTTGKRYLRIQPGMGRGEAGTEGAIADTGGALSSNVTLTRKFRVLYTIGGTNPSFTFVVYGIHAAKGSVPNAA